MNRIAALVGMAGIACQGEIGDPAGRDDPSTDPMVQAETPFGGTGGVGMTTPETQSVCKTPSAGSSPLRRLSRMEYTNTVRDLLGVPDTQNPGPSFPPDAEVDGYDNAAAVQTPSASLVSGYGDAARDLAASAVQNLPKLLSCDTVASGEDTCARTFLVGFGKRAYRRLLSQPEQERLYGFYASQKARFGFRSAIEQAITATLLSPHFTYRVEVGAAMGGQVEMIKLTPHEVASRLSYLIWESMPDTALFTAAEGGVLSTPAQVATQADRMLRSPKARSAVAHFNRQWLQLDAIDDPQLFKDAKTYPAFTPALRGAMKAETSMFLDDLMFGPSATLKTLLTADYTFANQRLAAFYKTPGPTSDLTFEKTALPAGKRAGILTQASFLSVHATEVQSSPIARGVFVLEHLLCTVPPDPPNDGNIVPPMVQPGVTTRQRFEMHDANPCASACHSLFDPIGYTFENYDGIGAWRDRDQGISVNSVGQVQTPKDVAGSYKGAIELASKLADSDSVRACVTQQWFRFAQGRQESEADACSLGLLRDSFKNSGYDLRKLIVAMTQTPAFLYKTRGAP